MAIEKFNKSEIDELYNLIVNTINISYFSYYPEEAISSFIDYSNKENILLDSANDIVVVIKEDNKIVATGTLKNTHIKRVFVHPDFQGKGYGKQIMAYLEQKAIDNGLKLVELHSSLFAKRFYDTLGYKMFKLGKVIVDNDERLYFQRMAKRLSQNVQNNQDEIEWDFHKKQFKVVKNEGEDIEVTEDTVFDFLQNQELIYAEYVGGKVKYGEIFGLIENDQIYFYYSQENLVGGKNQGSSIDQIKRLENNKIQLIDEWEWKNKSGKGVCIMEEI